MRTTRWALALSLLAAAAGCTSQPRPATSSTRAQALTGLTQVKDIATGTNSDSGDPQLLVVAGGRLFYVNAETTTGTELWTSDGTPGGTRLVRDIYPGINSPGISSMVALGSSVVFSADDGTHGRELWVSDGTFDGTTMIDIATGTNSGNVANLVNVNGTVFFSANDGSHGVELWKTDGTPAGTAMVADISPGGSSSGPALLTSVNRTLFFTADDGTHGTEVWKSDGTAAGTQLVADLAPGSTSSNPALLVSAGGKLFFTANDGTHGTELWSTNGTSTTMAPELVAGTGSGGFAALTSLGGFVAYACNDLATGYELCFSDGTTVTRKELNSGSAGSNPSQFVVFQGSYFFTANDGTHGTELWRCSNSLNCNMLADIATGGNSSNPGNLFNFENSRLYFSADDGVHGTELWTSDGRAVSLMTDLWPGSSGNSGFSMTDLNGKVVFNGTNGTGGQELFITDGTGAGTSLVYDTISPADALFFNTPIIAAGSRLYFTVNDPLTGFEPWSSDGTSDGTALLKDVLGGLAGSGPRNYTAVGSKAFFTATDGIGTAGHGNELWVTDGTPLGTMMLEINATGTNNSNGASPSQLVNAGGTLFMTADDGVHGREVWKSDGTPGGTSMVLDINPTGTSSSNPGSLFAFGSKVLFAASDGVHGNELWVSDGTPAGTTMIEIAPSTNSSNPGNFVLYDGAVYFSANDASHGTELWKTDGTPDGTSMVVDLSVGDNSTNPSQMVACNGKLFFWTTDQYGAQLWKTDGTADGTKLVATPFPDGIGFARQMVATSTRLFFILADSVHGSELWTSDGTTEGTHPVMDIVPGPVSGVTSTNSNPLFVATGGVVLFAGYTFADGVELWRSDGTPEGTFEVVDLNPGPGNSNPWGFVQMGNKMFFGASDGVTGYELWSLDLSAVVDTTAPRLSCPADQSTDATSASGARVSYPAATANDDFGVAPTVTYSQASGTLFPLGDTLVTVNAHDSAGNNAPPCSFHVTVKVPAPVLTAPADGSSSSTLSVAVSGTAIDGALVEVLDGANIVALLPVSAGAFSGSVSLSYGAHSLTAKQLLGGVLSPASAAMALTVTDSSGPILSTVPTDLSAEATSASGAAVSWATPTASDTKDGARVVSCVPAAGSTFAIGTTPVLCTATDSDGHTASRGFNVTVADTTAPLLTCAGNLSVTGADPNGGPVSFSVAAIDLVTAQPTVTATPASGSTFSTGATTVHVTATDAAGNSAQCSFQVTVTAPSTTPNKPAGGCSEGGLALDGLPVALAVLAGLRRRKK